MQLDKTTSPQKRFLKRFGDPFTDSRRETVVDNFWKVRQSTPTQISKFHISWTVPLTALKFCTHVYLGETNEMPEDGIGVLVPLIRKSFTDRFELRMNHII